MKTRTATPKTIVVTGGGSGGHITPLLAVAHELKVLDPSIRIIYVGQKGDSLNDIPAGNANIDDIKLVRAGKFRRYHGERFLQRLADVSTIIKNIRDVFFVFAGIFQSVTLLRRLKPDVVFIKGGFVGVPVGLAAAWLKIPYVTHDSDALPGLANRIVARWARLHAVALPKEIYNYPADKTVTVGVPIVHHYRQIDAAAMHQARKQLQLDQYDKVVLITGGGLGAARVNNAVLSCATELLSRYPKLALVHVAGRNHEADIRQRYKQELVPGDQSRVKVKGFITNLHQYSAAADVVVTRAGGTAMAELAAQAKACVVVPNPVLSGGHQLKNARVLAARKAVRLVYEDTIAHDPHALMPAITELLDKPVRAARMGQKLATLARPDAAERLAAILANITQKDS